MLKTTFKSLIAPVLALSILSFSAPGVIAQSGYVQNFTHPSSTIATKRNEKIHGHPYFGVGWEKGRVWLQNGKKTPEMNLKYKPFTNELLFKKNGELLAVKPKTMRGFVLIHDHQRFLFKNGYHAPHYNIDSNSLLQVIYEGQVKLLKNYVVKFHRGRNPDPYSGVINSHFQHYDHYYLVDNKGKFHEVKLSKDDILGTLNSHKSELQAYAKAKNLDFGDEGDLVKILQEYDKMLKR